SPVAEVRRRFLASRWTRWSRCKLETKEGRSKRTAHTNQGETASAWEGKLSGWLRSSCSPVASSCRAVTPGSSPRSGGGGGGGGGAVRHEANTPGSPACARKLQSTGSSKELRGRAGGGSDSPGGGGGGEGC
ncbi:unnamed protein product, partial [Scytosiphon promiscuus]